MNKSTTEPTEIAADEPSEPSEQTELSERVELCELALEIAQAAGKVALEMADEARLSTDSKSTPTDKVTIADAASEKLITEMLHEARPDDSILGEEGTTKSGSSAITWHIDPIDGTVNYVYGLPNFCVSIAAALEPQDTQTDNATTILAGSVYNPTTNEMFSAAKGNGAYLNGNKISCNEVSDLSTALLATGFGYSSSVRKLQAQRLVNILGEIADIRRFGSAALDLCAVAQGQVDGYFESGLNQWDLAAGWLIAEEAGAKVGHPNGGPPNLEMTIACSPALFDGLAALLCTAWQRES